MSADTAALIKQIGLGEDSVLEWKTLHFRGAQVTGPHRDGLADEMAPMANTITGAIVLGVDDQSKTAIGITLDGLDAVEAWVRSICNDLIEPPFGSSMRQMKPDMLARLFQQRGQTRLVPSDE